MAPWIMHACVVQDLPLRIRHPLYVRSNTMHSLPSLPASSTPHAPSCPASIRVNTTTRTFSARQEAGKCNHT